MEHTSNKTENKYPEFLFFHTKVKGQKVEIRRRVEVTTTSSIPAPLSFTKTEGRVLESELYDGRNSVNSEIAIKTITKIIEVPRITFAGRIVPMTSGNANADMIELHIGVAVASTEQFSRKTGRLKAQKRAKKTPILTIYCTLDAVLPIFHDAVKRLEPVIRETLAKKESLKVAEPHVENVSLESILAEQTAD